MELPHFRYHPNPLATGAVVRREAICKCCGRQRDHVYVGSAYGSEDVVGNLCPWCIADGSAASRLRVQFSDGDPLVAAGVPDTVIEEVTDRTPGYNSWQQEIWQAHCGDACAFHGDTSALEIRTLDPKSLAAALELNHMKSADWVRVADAYQPAGNPAIYKFVCLHCDSVAYPLDFT